MSQPLDEVIAGLRGEPTEVSISVWYKATPDHEPQVFENVGEDRAFQGVAAFLSDMMHLHGEGVRKFTVEIE